MIPRGRHVGAEPRDPRRVARPGIKAPLSARTRPAADTARAKLKDKDIAPMVDLQLHAVQWCAQHGHPVLSLRTADDRFFVVAIAAEDAAALATLPDPAAADRPPRRFYPLIERMLSTLGAHLTEIRLHVGGDHMLRASLRLHTPQGDAAVPASFADGIALAQRGRLPLRIAPDDLGRVPLAPLFPLVPSAGNAPPPEAFRSLIESLDLDGFGAEPAGPA